MNRKVVSGSDLFAPIFCQQVEQLFSLVSHHLHRLVCQLKVLDFELFFLLVRKVLQEVVENSDCSSIGLAFDEALCIDKDDVEVVKFKVHGMKPFKSGFDILAYKLDSKDEFMLFLGVDLT